MNKLLELRNQHVEAHKNVLAFIDKMFVEYGPMLDELEKLSPTQISIQDGWVSVSYCGDKLKLGAAFGLLRRCGFMPNERPALGSTSYSTYFHKQDVPGMVFFNFSSTQCRRVKTGVRLVEEAVYELVCDDEVYPPEVLALSATEAISDEIPF